jgi:carbon starvation protein
MAFTTFVYDTLDVCTRLGRYVVQELTGWHGRFGRFFATAVTAGAPVYFLLQDPQIVGGKPVPVWRTFWGLFGASNQLLAALTLVGVTVWLWRTRRVTWVWLVAGLPAAWMYTVSVWELVRIAWRGLAVRVAAEPRPWAALLKNAADPLPWAALLLVGLAALMLVEAARVIIGTRTGPPRPQPVLAAAR